MTPLTCIKLAVREGRYEVTDHAKLEAETDGLTPLDVRHALLEGTAARKYTRDPRGTRYKIYGPARDGRMVLLSRVLRNSMKFEC